MGLTRQKKKSTEQGKTGDGETETPEGRTESNEGETETPEGKKQSGGEIAGVIISAISGISQSVSSVWTSSNQLKAKKQEIFTLEKEIELEDERGKNSALVAALEVKKAEVRRIESKEKANANVRAFIYGGFFLLFGFIFYIIFMQGKQENNEAVA